MKRILIAAAALLALAACTKEISRVESPENGAYQTITVNVAPFGDETKTAVTPTGGFTWSAGDQIGIYPVASSLGEGQTAQQIVFKINGEGDAKTATFTGTGWGLVTNGSYKYFSYYPYSAAAKYNEVAVSFADGLNQVANGSTAHLGGNDFLYAPQIQPEKATDASFTFKHLSALVQFEITVPDEVKTKNFTKMTVTAPSPLFTVSGKYDPSSATTSVAPGITENVYTDILQLRFNGGEGFTPDENGKIHAYFLIAPAVVSGKELSIKLWDEDNIPYIASKTPTKDITSQDYKTYQCNAVKKPLTVAEDLSANGTANCYIVPEMGRYKFLANVKGNGYDPLDEVNHNAAASIDMTGCTAEIIWETVNTNVAPAVGAIVSNATVEGNFIIFDATGAEGNALISLKNGSNEIVWSWHIWSTMADLEGLAQTYPNNAGVMMDRNLGALSATPGDGLTLGFHYQWGRPFPITGGCSKDGEISSTRMATTGTDLWVEEETDATKGTLAYSAANPTHFIYASASNFLKGTSTVSGNWLWTANDYATADAVPAFWGDAKTMYDPSPIGWKVPKGGSTGVWSTAGFSTENFIWNATETGRTFNSPAAYYPAAGYRGGNTAAQGGTVSGFGSYGNCWSSTVTDVRGYHLYFGSSPVNPSYSLARALGFSVRPCQE